MMTESALQGECPACADWRRKNEILEAKVVTLEAELAAARKNSANSSKPPSSDIVKARPKTNKRGRPKKRKIGGQPGHIRHQRTPFAAEEIDQTWNWYYDGCPCCGGQLHDVEQPPQVIQQIELLELPLRVEQHERSLQHCAHCHKTFRAAWPEELRRA